NGFKILEKNYRCPLGEIDVVAEKKGRTFFIEIKTRSQSYFGLPEESVNTFKQKRLVRLAQWYLKGQRLGDIPVSFGVLAVTWKGCEDPQVRLIENAFTADSVGEY
ncbi:MAG: YraN family protein, partial [Candidatus Omnitrophica bacterium]|nr:YraN family protein [Candidatus Omnitrophota bacterium]